MRSWLCCVTLLWLALAGCKGESSDTDTDEASDTDVEGVDGDLDGYDSVATGGEDCDDEDPQVYPGASEWCDGEDQDCDGQIDEDAVDQDKWYRDGDEDGYGWSASPVSACAAPDGYVELGGDCNDADADYHPGADEDDCTDPNDYNCDGLVAYADVDRDGWPACVECDDTRRDVYPGAPEVCDGVDNDCDTLFDEAGAEGELTWYADGDEDGFGWAETTALACTQPAGHVADDTDCLDTDGTVYPGADEYCDGVDADCGNDGDHGALDAQTWYLDGDGDGYGAPLRAWEGCEQPSGYVVDHSDCDDHLDEVHPGHEEVCDLLDNDCDRDIDEGCPEVCDDGFDNDGDGARDCVDEDCWLVCPEVLCLDGIDNDEDHLLDCEDGDCATFPGCFEDCTDGEDNDFDELVDCEDDDCMWGEDCRGAVVSIVAGGGPMRQRFYHGSFSSVGCYGSSWQERYDRRVGTVASVRGTVFILPGKATSLGTATTWASCAWSVASARFGETEFHYSESTEQVIQAVSRSGFYVESGCPVSTSGFLPYRLLPRAHRAGIPDGRKKWYIGEITSQDSTGTGDTSTWPCTYGTGVGRSAYQLGSATYVVGELYPGRSYIVLP